ncbi:hypothetical protein EGW08_009629, partial [Elysia chlorotica]
MSSMYSVHVVLLLFSCNVCLVSSAVKMRNLLPIPSKRAEIRHDRGNPGINFPLNGSCILLPKDIGNKTASLYIDLFTDYPIHVVNLQGKFVSIRHATITVSIDGLYHKYVMLYNNSMTVSYSPAQSGRLLALSTDVDINVCFIEIFTCTLGKTGMNCDQDCAQGFYGLSCKEQCKCRDSTSCDSLTGFCPSGCATSSVKAPAHCYYPTVKDLQSDMFSATQTAASTITRGPTKDLVSTKVYKPSEQCITLQTDCASKSLFLELSLTKPISLYGVQMTFSSIFYIPTPFSMYITSDGKPCYGLSLMKNSLDLKKHVFKCHRQNTTGKHILVRFSTYNKTALMNDTGVEINICQLKALECSSGFFGPNCRHVCSCADSDCDKMKGMCSGGRCSGNSKGPYCSSINVLPTANVVRKKFYDSRSGDSETIFEINDIPTGLESHSWLAIQFDGVYTINSLTLTVGNDNGLHKSIQVYIEPDLKVDNSSIDTYNELPGLPCLVEDPGRGLVTHELSCYGLARLVFVMVVSDSDSVDISSANMKIWSCVDGMFGADCEHFCNCRNVLERCDKISGSCLSGCALGYKGQDCLQVCEKNDPESSCPTQTCHCLGDDQSDCGPEVALCSKGCQPGWMGLSCNLPCPKGFFGANCDQKCGNCFYGNDTMLKVDKTCVPTNGTCLLGCADPDDPSDTCQNRTNVTTTSQNRALIQYSREARYMEVLENASVRVILGLIGVIIGCATLVIVVCCSLKCYWDRVSYNKRINEKRVEMLVRRAMNTKIDKKV